MAKSPLLTGEDPQGAEGLQTLLTLRSSLSPLIGSKDMWERRRCGTRRRWDALVTAAADDLKIERERISPNLEALPAPSLSVKKEPVA